MLALIASFTNVLALKRLNRSDRISFINSFALQAIGLGLGLGSGLGLGLGPRGSWN